MPLFTDTITVFNYHKKADGKDGWNRTVIKNVQFTRSTDKNISNDGRQDIKDTINVTFPENVLKNYIDYIAYIDLDSTKAIKYFTFNSINNLDVIVKGNVNKEISSTYKITDLKKDYTECGTISGMRDNRSRSHLKNIKVVLK